ncbi:Mmp37-domain-containing protein [Coniophora puteana RWD-64-598 SS2]|uniref:Phosphatidate cytidylyltransferase, mitochondrial n=1 Tax=Coniophora puteana (strain RWD-64-598) TaxID=741705 RepID=A0A5M3MQS8_CONPW|nr:Mmp37-domain-containing protein [Coniophora puteana RWD-64-598 SS2]EIW81430.1 Mmp37-domain-containing protein [Coniophora puteana RWD-64-598 SS2]
MLSAARLSSCSRLPQSAATSAWVRGLATDSTTHADSLPPPPLRKQESTKPRSATAFNPRPRSTAYARAQALSSLPPSFGSNQLLPVADSTRALLEDIVGTFNAPIRYAFAYGSGVFEQAGYSTEKGVAGKEGGPMLDFIFAVSHADHWHSINMTQNPGHYPLHARAFGSSFVSKVQETGPGLWFNASVPIRGTTIKYGVVTVDTLCADLLNWRTLYLAGRMHKPIRIIKDDPRVRLTQQVNLTSAIRTALLTLPETFSQAELFTKIASISYSGDPRMLLPAENRAKVANIVSRQEEQFRELYWRLVRGLPGVQWDATSSHIRQDTSPSARSAHLRKLPAELLARVQTRSAGMGPPKEADEAAYWLRLAGDGRLPEIVNSEMASIVRYPATVQSLKGIVSAGLGKSMRYTAAKVGKWWKGRGSGSASSS